MDLDMMIQPLEMEIRSLAQTRAIQEAIDGGESRIQQIYRERVVFITGGSGFIGKQLIEKLLRSCHGIKKIYLLVRPKKGETTQERIHSQLKEPVILQSKRLYGFIPRMLKYTHIISLFFNTFEHLEKPFIKLQPRIFLYMQQENKTNANMDNIIPTDMNKTGELPKHLEIFEGARIMLRSNIDIAKGLVNGVIGYITEIIWHCFRRAQMYATDIPSVQVYNLLRTTMPDFEDRVQGIQGDITQVGLGISERDRKLLVEEVNFMYHVAASVRFNEPLKQAVLTNIRATQEMMLLARECKNLLSMVHVSTAYVHCYKKDCLEEFYHVPVNASTLIDLVENADDARIEDMTPALLGEWPNTYTFTKAIAEHVVKTMGEGLPVCIVRPAIVLCAYREPELGWVDPRNAFGPTGLVVGVTLGIIHVYFADFACKIDFVPVDFVNNLLIAASWNNHEKNTNGRSGIEIFTLGAYENRMTWRNLSDILRQKGEKLISPDTKWYCYAAHTTNRYVYDFLSLTNHFILSLVADAFLVLVGKKPFITKIYKKIYNEAKVFNFFMTNTWRFHEENTKILWQNMSVTDQKIFNYNMKSVNLTELVLIWVLGARKHIILDGLKGTEGAVKKQFWFKIGHYIYVAFVVLLFWMLLSFLFSAGKFALRFVF